MLAVAVAAIFIGRLVSGLLHHAEAPQEAAFEPERA